ncbi:hypothetical protein HYV31_01260 [candidate division WWE3 bacterium]|nr:hypothetical protein [candidate division WWE3 bacterium]
MSSILIFGGDGKARKDKITKYLTDKLNLKISENNPDVIFITPEKDKKSIGIGVVKELNKYISEKPMVNKFKAVVVENGDLLTEQAQNSLLKVLEEHPAYCFFILGAKSEDSLLETVISRCIKLNLTTGLGSNTKRITTKNEKENKTLENTLAYTNVHELIDKRVGDRLVWAIEENEKEREEVIEDIENMIGEIRKSFFSDTGENHLKDSQRIELLLKVKKDLEETNVTLKLALEYIAVKL